MQQYDIVVEGMNFGTLAAAVLLSASGKTVLISTAAASPAEASGAWSDQGFNFSPGPWCAFGLEDGGAVRRLIGDLGISGFESVRTIEYQVALPDRRITVFRDNAATLAELKREFPGEFRTLEEFYRVLAKEAAGAMKNRVKKYLAVQSTASRFIRRFRFSPELLSFFDVQARYFLSASLTSISLNSLMQLCLTRPVAVPRGDRMGNALAAAVISRGGVIRYQESDSEIVFRRSRAVGLKTARDTVDARSVLVCDEASSVTGVYLGVNEQVIPAGMFETVLYLPDYSRPSRIIAINASSPNDREAAPQHMRSLAVVASSAEKQFLSEELIARCSDIIPFLRDHLVVEKPLRRVGPSRLVAEFRLKPVSAGGREPILFKTSRSRLFVYRNASYDVLHQVPAIRAIVNKLA